MNDSDERQLIERAKAGDAEAFIGLCERHRERVWRVVSSVACRQDRDDLAQEAIVRAYASVKTCRGEAGFGPWLCRIALNAAYDYQRSAWRRHVVGLDAAESLGSSDTPHETAERREMQVRVRRSVAALPARLRDPIWLRYFEGFSLVEIASLEGTNESTIRSRIQSGVKRLAGALQDFQDSETSIEPAVEPTMEGTA